MTHRTIMKGAEIAFTPRQRITQLATTYAGNHPRSQFFALLTCLKQVYLIGFLPVSEDFQQLLLCFRKHWLFGQLAQHHDCLLYLL